MLIGFFGTALFTVGTTFWILGAWPVMGFCGLELVLLYAAFQVNFHSGRAYERLLLNDDGLEVSRMRPDGAVSRVWRLQPAWLHIDIDDPPEHDSQLTLSSHGRRMVVGSFLTPDERLEVAEALRDAVQQWRTAPHPSATS